MNDRVWLVCVVAAGVCAVLSVGSMAVLAVAGIEIPKALESASAVSLTALAAVIPAGPRSKS